MENDPTRRFAIGTMGTACILAATPSIAFAGSRAIAKDDITVTPIPVRFDSAGIQIAGHLYLPDANNAAPRPAIVVGHPGSGVKEQAAGLYARRMAEQGLITLAFDAAHTGESGGVLRGLEDPAQRIEDIKSAVSFLSVHPDVDPEHIGLLGICASGGYAVNATATDSRIRALAMVSGVDIGTFFRQGHDGRQNPAELASMLDHAAKARTAAARGEGIARFPVFPVSEAEARAGGRYVYEGWDYYCTPRGEHPRAAKTMPWISVDRIAGFDGFAFVDMVAPRPLLMIMGSEADTRWIGEKAFAAAAEPKQLHWIEGASHVDLYDRDAYVTPAVTRLAAFFRDALG
jgi:fermentation-respiration switch protein FrsA (DUF1100 family)